MKRNFFIILGLVGSKMFYGQISTQQLGGATINPITTAVPFLLISPDSKQGGMGDLGAATDPDVNSIHWNGSKLAFMDKKFGVGLTVTPWLRRLVPDINMYYLSGYAKLNSKQTIGGSLRYFSLGNIELTDVTGFHYSDAKPNEFAVDVAFSQKLSKNFSLGVATRFVNSTISRYYFNGSSGNAASTVAVDLSMFYRSEKFKLGDKTAVATGGLALTNLGAKIKYSNDQNFIPMNMRLGGGLKTDIDKFNTFGVYVDFTTLLVPTPPEYPYLKNVSGGDSSAIAIDPSTQKKIIKRGKDPNVGVTQGILQSFSDAPGGFNEELKEVNIGGGLEYCYNNILSIRTGYFHESKTKGARQYFTLGVGFKFKVINVDGAYLIPTALQNPLQNTWRITLSFNFDPAEKTEGASEPVQPN
ncbi:MAG: type IX secretion system outer membrane channel protein PorV [Bacteroidia bacterium]|nr:type IX secretion system outer membrane channel protein PorV [Bacteroidia bacterium]